MYTIKANKYSKSENYFISSHLDVNFKANRLTFCRIIKNNYYIKTLYFKSYSLAKEYLQIINPSLTILDLEIINVTNLK